MGETMLCFFGSKQMVRGFLQYVLFAGNHLWELYHFEFDGTAVQAGLRVHGLHSIPAVLRGRTYFNSDDSNMILPYKAAPAQIEQ